MVIDVLGVARQALVEEKRLADASNEPIIYYPRVPAWRSRREQDPVQHLWQGVSEERLAECAEMMDRRTGGKLLYAELSDWVPVYREVYEQRVPGYQLLGLLYNALYRFEPAIRPVLMRLLALWRGLYEIASQDWKGSADSQQAFEAGLEQFAKASETVGRDRLCETPTTTLEAARKVATGLAPRSLGLPAS